MKMTGTLLRPASRLSRRQVSNPSMPGMTASSRTISGVIWSTMRMALAPSSATITVMPAPSSASVNSRSVSGESSTTSATSRFFGSVIIRADRLQGCHVLIKVKAVDQVAHLRYEVGMFGAFAGDLVELDADRLDVADLAEANQLLDMPDRRPGRGIGPPAQSCNLIRVIGPLDFQKLPDRFKQTRNVDRLHQIAVVKGLRERPAMRLQCARRNHQD